MFPTGIDWSEKHLDFCITNERGDVILRERVDNDTATRIMGTDITATMSC